MVCPFLPAGLPCPAKEVNQLAHHAVASDLEAVSDCAGQAGAAGDEYARLVAQQSWLQDRFPELNTKRPAVSSTATAAARATRSGSGDSNQDGGGDSLAAQFRKLDFDDSGFGSYDRKSAHVVVVDTDGHANEAGGGANEEEEEVDDDYGEGVIWYASAGRRRSSGGDDNGASDDGGGEGIRAHEVAIAYLSANPLSVSGQYCGSSSSILGGCTSGGHSSGQKQQGATSPSSQLGRAGAAQALCVITASPAYRNAALAAFPVLAVAYAEGAVEIRLLAAEVAPTFFDATEIDGGGNSGSAFWRNSGPTPSTSRAMASHRHPSSSKPPMCTPPRTSELRNPATPASAHHPATTAVVVGAGSSLQATGYLTAQLPLWRALYNDATQLFLSAANPAANTAAPGTAAAAAASATSVGCGPSCRRITGLDLAWALAWNPNPVLFARAREALGLGTSRSSTSSSHRRKSALALTGVGAVAVSGGGEGVGTSQPSELERVALDLELLGALTSFSSPALQRSAEDPLDFAAFADALARHAQVIRTFESEMLVALKSSCDYIISLFTP